MRSLEVHVGEVHGQLGTVISLADLARASSLGGRLEELRQRTVLLAATASAC